MILMSLHAMTEIFFGSGLSVLLHAFSLHIWSHLAHAPTQQVSLTEAWKKLINSTCLIPFQVSHLTLKEKKQKSTMIVISLAPESAWPFLLLLTKTEVMGRNESIQIDHSDSWSLHRSKCILIIWSSTERFSLMTAMHQDDCKISNSHFQYFSTGFS